MSKPDTRQTLEALLQQLENADLNDAEKQAVLDDLRAALRRRIADEEDHDNFLERLQHSVEYFEVTHPDLTSVLSAAINVLSTGGV